MNEKLFDINNFNIIQDSENYYFFRALNMADNNDIEQQLTVSEDGTIERIRTDRERFDGETKYKEDSENSLEEMYDHIKIHYSKETNCISLTSNGNIAINYGRGSYKDKYIMVKIPKKEFGNNVVVAGQYMLKELYSRIQQVVDNLEKDKRQEILSIFEDIDKVNKSKELKDIIAKRYIAKNGEVDTRKAYLKKGIVYSPPQAKISSYQSLNEEQLLEVNKVYAKLAVLENENILKYVISNSANSGIRKTIGIAFSSSEVIHYKDIKQENIIEVSKEIVDIFALIQQVDNIDKNKIEELKQAVLVALQSGKTIPQMPEIEEEVKKIISIEEMYELTEGKVEYGKADSIVKNMFYLSKSRKNTIILSNILTDILGEDSDFEDIIDYIRENGFRIEPEIITRKSGKGIKLSESVNLDLQKEEIQLVDEIKNLSLEELEIVLQNGGLNDTRDIITRTFNNVKDDEVIDKTRYYAEAIISQYNWQDIGIEEFKIFERNELIKRLQERNCIEIYKQLKDYGIEENKIPTLILNITMRDGFYEKYKQGDLKDLLDTRQDILQNNINIEIVERFLGYYDVENTDIRLKDYQQRACDNIDKIFEDKKFAQVILPTGAGKTFVALAQMQKYALEHPNEKMLYLAPQEEILNQVKSYIIKYIHGNKGTVGKSVDEIVDEIFPNIKFETYSGLLAKRGKEVIEDEYGMIVLDELHRTGAKEWEGQIDKLLENQNENVKVLGITATPTRDVDGRDMANETAKKLGYTDKEIKQRKHIASNMTLENAIRMGYVVNPKLVYCKYDIISSGKMDELRLMIDDIEDETKKAKELQKYNELREKLNKEIDEEIGEETRKKLEEEARRNLDSGIGKEEILKQNVKKGGKYIVFIPVTDQGDIEDEEGNRIGLKTGGDKIKAYQEYLNEIFKGTDIVPQCHAMSGEWNGKEKNKLGQDKNQQELNTFELDNTDKTKFMVVMNKANEGLHIDGVDGIIWFRALDENSRILYLQQLGRTVFAIDEDNPLPDDKRPIIIDLANNSLTVKMEKEFENIHPIDDLESLTILLEWINNHDRNLPNQNSTNKQEQHYYSILRRIQNNYKKYLEGFDEHEELAEEEKTRIEEIIELASEIDLWSIDLPLISIKKESKNEINPFKISGILRDFIELEDEVYRSSSINTLYQNALKIETWCKLNYGHKETWERNLPSTITNDKEEKRLGRALINIRKRIKQYEEKELKEIENEEDRKIVGIIRKLDEEYGLSELLKNALEIENWCKLNYADKEIWERRMPSYNSKDKEEKRLGGALGWIRKKIKPYEDAEIETVKCEEDRKIVEIIRKLNKEYGESDSVKKALQIENWCKLNYGDKEIWERRLPNKNSNDEEEKKLGIALANMRQKLKVYAGIKIEEVANEEERRIVEIIRKLDEEYGVDILVRNALEIENWCRLNFGDKEIWERRLPSKTFKNEEEKRLGRMLNEIRRKLKPYEGKKLDEIEDEKDKKLVGMLRKLDEEYGLSEPFKNALEIENWCKLNYGENEAWNKRLPQVTEKNAEEKRLGIALGNIRKKIKQYKGKKLEEIENEEDRKIIEIIRRLDEEYGLSNFEKKALEIENWCKLNNDDKEKWERCLPNGNSDEQYERKLGLSLSQIRIRLKKYEGKKIEEIENEKDRKIIEIIKRLDEEYGLSPSIKNALEIENWCKLNNEDKEIWEKRLPNKKSENMEEIRLNTALSKLRQKIKKHKMKNLEEVENEEDRKIIEIIRRVDKEYGLSILLKNTLKIENWCKVKYADKPMWERKLPSESSADKEEKVLNTALDTIRIKMIPYKGKKLEEIENEEDRRIIEIIRRLDEEYGLSNFEKKALEIENWCKLNYGDKEFNKRKLPREKSQDKEEKRLGRALTKIRQRLREYEEEELEKIENEEDRRLVEILRRIDEEYNPRKSKNKILQQAKQERDNAKEKNEKVKELEKEMTEELQKRGSIHEETIN